MLLRSSCRPRASRLGLRWSYSRSPHLPSKLVAAIDSSRDSVRRDAWPERDRAIIFTALLAGLRAEELISADLGDIRRIDEGGGVLHVHGKGN